MGDRAFRVVRFARELYRRRVPRVAAAYILAGWAVVVFSKDLSEFLDLPVWAPKLFLGLLILGFPVTIAVAWAFDLTPHGVVRTPAGSDLAPRHVARPNYGKPVGTVLIAATVVFLAVWSISRSQWGGWSGIPAGRVAVMPAEIRTGSEGPVRLDRTLASLIAWKLEGMNWAIVEDTAVFGEAERMAFANPGSQGAGVAGRLRAESFLEIGVAYDGDVATLSASLYAVREPALQIAHGEAVGSSDNLLPLVDEVSAELAGLALPIPQQSIAVLPAAVQGEEAYEYLSEVVPFVLSSKLEMVGWPTLDGRPVLGAIQVQARRLAAEPGMGPAQTLLSDGQWQAQELDNRLAARIAREHGAGLFVLTRIVVEDSGITDVSRHVGDPRVRVAFNLFHVNTPDVAILGDDELDARLSGLPELLDGIAHDLIEWAGVARWRTIDISAVPTGSLRALEAYTTGDRAFRNGDIATARTAFHEAVSEDPTFALANYRLSVAAEWNSNNADPWKELGLRNARANRGRLPWRQQLLVEARDIWKRTGETDRTEQLYEWVITNWEDDWEATFQLAELVTHEGPLRGRSAIEAGSYWRKLRLYDESDFTVLLHLARVLALEGRQSELENLVAQALELGPSQERKLELEAIPAFASKDAARSQRIIDDLAVWGDSHLIWNVASRVGVYTRNMTGAEEIARLLVDAARPDSTRLLGHVTLAHLLLAQGRWRDALAELELAERIDPLIGMVHTVMLATSGIVPELPRARQIEIRDRLVDWQTSLPTAQPVTEITAHDSIQDGLRLYSLATISLALGSASDAKRYMARLQDVPGTADAKRLGQRFAQCIEALVLREDGFEEAAAEKWDSFRVEAGADKVWLSPFFALSRERFIRAVNLKEVGRSADALRMFSSLGEATVFDLAYLAPALFHHAEMLAADGDLAGAWLEYGDFIELWHNADPELQPMVARARERLRGDPAVTD